MKSRPKLEPEARLRLLIAMGTRPEIIKLAPGDPRARSHSMIEAVVFYSGQHTDLAEPMSSSSMSVPMFASI
ncbi:MAG: hypothetical protein U0892_07225 [Pirellulales bacterium]